MAFRDGKELIEHDRIEQGLGKFNEALTLDPRNPEYRQALLQTRERAIYRLLEQAQNDRLAGHKEDAVKRYQRVLAIDPSNSSAKAGLQQLDLASRHAQALAKAQEGIDKKEFDTARALVTTILTENPANTDAIAMQKTLAQSTPQVATETVLGKAYKKPISIEFKDVSLKQVFEVISRTSGMNFLFDKEVHTDQKTSIFLKNSTIESAVHFTLLTNQLEQRILDANTILIYPNTAVKQHEYQDLMVRSFFLTNADVKVVANTLKTIVKSRDIVIDEKLNMLIMRDSPEAIRVAEKLVALHDVPEPEVMLEVEILEVKRTRLLELGIQWPSSLSLTPLPLGGAVPGGLTLRDLRGQNSGTLAAGIGPVTAKARADDSDAKLLANPRIRTRNHEKAKILIGERVPNITTTATSTGFVSESINYVDVGLTLNVEPTIYLDNDVAIKVQLEVSNIVSQLKTQSGSVAYQIGTRTANTVLRLKDGETQVLAGLINDEDRRSGSKVPGIGELPLVGRLFGSGTDDNQKTEIVLSITPHLIRNIQRPDAVAAQFAAGTDASFRAMPVSNGGVMPPTISAPAISSAAGPATNHTVAPVPNNPSTPGNTSTPIAAEAKILNKDMNSNVAASASNNSASVSVGPSATGIAGSNGPSTGLMQVQWQGPATVKAGDTFTLQLLMQSDQPVTGLPLAIGFDSKALQAVGITEGEFLKQGGAKTSFNSRIEPGGRALLSATRIGDGGATNLAEVATITFKALAPTSAARVTVLMNGAIGLTGKTLSAATAPAFQVQIQ